MKRENKAMNDKKVYESPKMEVITFEAEDVITDSDEMPTQPSGQGLDDDFYLNN